MCNIVVINRGEKEIETPRQFEEHFGFLPDKDINYNSYGNNGAFEIPLSGRTTALVIASDG